ncbi:hypothetical protein [Paenibacillus radicis (ex Gao et al. 2016)]|uniref:Uncharacterized protein n=1 Tax=Paenibacillus radicis (ex Gao et al. 2016) TaxID=1737354 RepID=A0A917GST0_9BACL|nr:hypothetical protein [Paenibacillus radicis (ex Gao et al. 2016)]GGG56182.1 hypothetical protein GCM10010918_06420 [Paenibacillus radicis (ex Gao et al. 2016)]
MRSTTAIVKQWVDDHLDLLNYARQIGDADWQREIIAVLKQAEQQTKELVLNVKAEELWRQFDRINAKMLELYNQLRGTNDAFEIHSLKEEVWALKLKRLELSNLLKQQA